MLYLINSGKPTTKKKHGKKKPSRKQIAARKKFAQMARARANARKGARKAKAARTVTRGATPLRKNVHRSVGGSQMAAKRKTHRKRKGVSARKSSVGQRRRSPRRKSAKSRTMTLSVGKRGFGVRSNPGVVGMVVQGAKDAGAIVGGKVAANVVARAIPLADTGAMGIVKRVGAAALVGFAANKFLSRDTARLMLAGGLTAVIESAARAVLPANIVAIGLAGEDADALGAYLAGIEEGAALGADEALGAYLQAGVGADDNGVGAYPEGIGEAMGMSI